MVTSLQFPMSYLLDMMLILGFPCDTVLKNKSANAGDPGDMGSILGSGRFAGVGAGNTPVFLPGKFHGQRSQQAAVHGILKSQTGLSTHTMLNCAHLRSSKVFILSKQLYTHFHGLSTKHFIFSRPQRQNFTGMSHLNDATCSWRDLHKQVQVLHTENHL